MERKNHGAWRGIAAVTLAFASLVATPTQALVVTFDSSARTTDFFDGMPYEVKLGFLGNATQGCCIPYEGLNFFAGAARTATLVENVPLVLGVNNSVVKYPSTFSPAGPDETKEIGFTFSLLAPGVIGPSTHEIEMDVHVRYVASSFDEFLLWNYGPIADPSVTFDLGVNGILDVTFVSFSSTTSGAFEGSHAGRGNSGAVSATFLLRDVPQLPAAIPEPSILLLLGSGLGLLGAALGRRHDAVSRSGA